MLILVSCTGSGVSDSNESQLNVDLSAISSDAPVSAKRVIFILLDAARADHFGCYGYERNTTPNIDKMATKGAVFLNHFSQSYATRESMPQIFTARYLGKNIIACYDDYPVQVHDYPFISDADKKVMLTDIFRENGFKTAIFSAHAGITEDCPLGESVDEFYDLTKGKGVRPNAGKVLEKFSEWLVANRDKNFFAYLHLMDTHFPHVIRADNSEFVDPFYSWKSSFNPDGYFMRRVSGPLTPEDGLGFAPVEFKHVNAIYDGDLKYADRLIGRLWELIRKLHIEEETLLIITSDHGEELGEHPTFGHTGKGAWDSSYHVPMIFLRPGKIKSERIKGFSQHVDILPTLVEMFDLSVPREKTWDGKSLMPMLSDPESKIRDFALGIWVTYDGGKFIRTKKWIAGRFQKSSTQLYDVVSDGRQIYNIAKSNDNEVERLFRILDGETAEAMERWENAVINRPESPFVINFSKLTTICKDGFFVKRDGHLSLPPPGVWEKASSLTARGGNVENASEVAIRLEAPAAEYEVCLGVVHSYTFYGSEASKFVAAVGNNELKRFSTEDTLTLKERLKRGEGKRIVYIPLGTVNHKDEKIKVRVRPDTESDAWVRIQSVMLRPLSGSGNREGPSEEQKNKLKALGYLK